MRQYFANGYFEELQALRDIDAKAPGHLKQSIANGLQFEIRPEHDERLRVGQILFVAGQEKEATVLGIITEIKNGRIIAYCNGHIAEEGLNISVERRNNTVTSAQILGQIDTQAAL